MGNDSPRHEHHILAIDPFHGGSHRQFLSGVVESSRHRWSVVGGKPVHWKWRMRSAPLELSLAASETIAKAGCPDVIFCTDMLDLPGWRGLMRSESIQRTPAVAYFHENQWTYPVASQTRPDFHFGYTNLLTAIAADACWFNSEYHLRDFLQASEAFVRRMPDARPGHDFSHLREKSKVIYPGFHPIEMEADGDCGEPSEYASTTDTESAVNIGWVSRWEHDKRPDRFADLLDRLKDAEIPFRLILLGPRPKQGSADHARIIRDHGSRVDFDGYAARPEYVQQLQSMDLVVSTADHEFFGIAICEAISAGAVPVLPNGLSYPELVPKGCLYDDLADAQRLILQSVRSGHRIALSKQCREKIAGLRTMDVARQIDSSIDELVDQSR